MGWGDVDDFDGPDDVEEEQEPTAAERLLYALGQLYCRWHNGELAVAHQLRP